MFSKLGLAITYKSVKYHLKGYNRHTGTYSKYSSNIIFNSASDEKNVLFELKMENEDLLIRKLLRAYYFSGSYQSNGNTVHEKNSTFTKGRNGKFKRQSI